MTSTKYKLGELIEQLDGRNTDNKYKVKDVRGISTAKEFIKTKADMKGVLVTSYKIVTAGDFAFVPDTSRRGDKMSLAYNSSDDTYIVSSISCVFRISDTEKLSPDYLYIYFNRPEFDRFARFNSWGSARETFTWEDMCDIDIDLPPIEIQRKYVDIYKSMLDNQKCYERGLEDLKLTCEGYIEELRRKTKCEAIGQYIQESSSRNTNLNITRVQGVNSSSEFDETRANMSGIDLSNYKVVNTNDFAYNPSRVNLGSIALLRDKSCIVSPMYIVFNVINENKLLPEYLMLWFERKEFQRSTLFYGMGSVRDTFSFDLMKEVEIPIPDISTQRLISNIYAAYIDRKKLGNRIALQTKNICPILIKGSLEEANK